MRKLFSLGVLALLLSVLSSPVVAAVEDCETLKGGGGSKGLYGMCIAYWNSVSNHDDSGLQSRSVEESNRFLDRYNAIRKRVGGPEMPGLSLTMDCPCWSHLTPDEAVIGAVVAFCALGTELSFDTFVVLDDSYAPLRLFLADNHSCTYSGLDRESRLGFPHSDTKSGPLCRDEIEDLCP